MDKNANKKEIIDYLIYFIHANKKNINELPEPEIYQFSSTKEIISCIRNKKLIIVNSSLLIFSKNLQNKLTYFNLGKNNIKINFNDGPSFSINISDNIISLKTDDNEQNQNLIGHYNKNKDNIFDEYNLESKCQNIFINQNFAIPPLIGLDNIEATCYMNATLQCLCNIPKFVNFFKYNKHLIEYVKNDLVCGNARLSSSFKLLIEKLWPDRQNFPSSGKNNAFSNKKNESYAPKEFKEKISKMNSLFEGVRVNDPGDLLNFLIVTLHTELNVAYKNNMNNNSIILDQRNQQLMFQIFSENFMKNNQSIISDLFYGVNYNVIQCQGCMSKSYNFQIFFYFEFPLEKVRIFKQNNLNNNNINNDELSIYDCFQYEQRINYMAGNDAMYCNYCKQIYNCTMLTLLAFCPEIIIIILNRGEGNQNKEKINISEELNLYNFIEIKEVGFNYELIGVITQVGEIDMGAHFIAYCKSPINNTWYQYNDSFVNEVLNLKSEVLDNDTPYTLFYQKINI